MSAGDPEVPEGRQVRGEDRNRVPWPQPVPALPAAEDFRVRPVTRGSGWCSGCGTLTWGRAWVSVAAAAVLAVRIGPQLAQGGGARQPGRRVSCFAAPHGPWGREDSWPARPQPHARAGGAPPTPRSPEKGLLSPDGPLGHCAPVTGGGGGLGGAHLPWEVGDARPCRVLQPRSVFFTTTRPDSWGLLPRVPTLRSQLSAFLLAFGAWG